MSLAFCLGLWDPCKQDHLSILWHCYKQLGMSPTENISHILGCFPNNMFGFPAAETDLFGSFLGHKWVFTMESKLQSWILHSLWKKIRCLLVVEGMYKGIRRKFKSIHFIHIFKKLLGCFSMLISTFNNLLDIDLLTAESWKTLLIWLAPLAHLVTLESLKHWGQWEWSEYKLYVGVMDWQDLAPHYSSEVV